jgi:hypothetical protein
LTIGLSAKDREFLVEISKLLSADEMVNDRMQKTGKKWYPVSTLTLCSKKMSLDLEGHGAGRKKTFRLNLPLLSSSLMPHFIRGYFDGDGGVYVNKKRNSLTLSIAGFTPFINSIRRWLNSMGIQNVSISRVSDNLSYVLIGRRDELMRMCDILYASGGICLLRKKEKLLAFLSSKHKDADTKDV